MKCIRSLPDSSRYNGDVLRALLQFSDSALPIGTAAHSFGLETLVEDGAITPQSLHHFLAGHLAETGTQELVFVRRAWRNENLEPLHREFDARRPARESREATLKTGRRFCELFRSITGMALAESLHYPIAFGAAMRLLEVPEEMAAQAYLQQSVTTLVSACQRLMPLGQLAASRIVWDAGPAIQDAIERSRALDCASFSVATELASFRHPLLETRLFIS